MDDIFLDGREDGGCDGEDGSDGGDREVVTMRMMLMVLSRVTDENSSFNSGED